MYPTVQYGSARDVYLVSHCTRDARVAQAETRARVAIEQARAEAEALVRTTSDARDQALAQTAQA